MNRHLRIGIIGGGENSAVGKVHLASIRMDGKYEIGPSMFSHIEEENKKSDSEKEEEKKAISDKDDVEEKEPAPEKKDDKK